MVDVENVRIKVMQTNIVENQRTNRRISITTNNTYPDVINKYFQ